ncbi:MAG: hypothetical protein HY789_07365, partial [Deltaproteobacteria bacterium]|nr:hypothetical protein [Deltaproteobacteria bacterium]
VQGSREEAASKREPAEAGRQELEETVKPLDTRRFSLVRHKKPGTESGMERQKSFPAPSSAVNAMAE